MYNEDKYMVKMNGQMCTCILHMSELGEYNQDSIPV